MKLMLATDIHGSAHWAKKIIERLEVEEADYLVLLGDLLYHGPRNPLPEEYNPQEVAKLLNNVKSKIIAIRGNCDSEVDQLVLEFPMLADYNFIPFENNKIMISHGHIYDERTLPKSLEAGDIFIFGHIHVPVLKQENGIHILNPGSVSLPKENHPNTYAILENELFQVKTFDGLVYKEANL